MWCLIYLPKKIFMYKLLFLLFIGIFITSCNSDVDAGEFVVGSDYLAVTNKVILIDTLTIDVSTVKLDSLTTSNESRILVGNYDDSLFGKVNSDSYFHLSTTNFNLYSEHSDTDATGYVFDSIAMVFKYDDYYYADTTKVQTLSIHRVLQKFKPNTNDDSFYNSSTLNYDTGSLGTLSYRPKPIGKDSITIKMDNDFGIELFNKFKNNEINNSDEFADYLKGFVLKSTSTTSTSMIGFSLSSVLHLYYSKGIGDTEKSLKKNFVILDATKQFNGISLDRTGTFIQNLPLSKASMSSLQTGNRGFIQSGTGIVCRVDFPNIKQLKYISDKGAIVDAKLIIKPVKNSFSDLFPLAEKLSVYVVDQLNRIKRTLKDANNNDLSAILSNSKSEFDESTEYELSVGDFLRKEMVKESDSKYGLMFTLPVLSKVVDRLVLGDQTNKENKIQLKIYYITY